MADYHKASRAGIRLITHFTHHCGQAITWPMTEERLNLRVQLVVSRKFIDEVDEWRRGEPEIPNRSQAIRRLVDAGLSALRTKPKVSAP